MIIKNIENFDNSFDFTIIGSGPASITLALKLEENGFSSIIFEAGDLYPTGESQDFYSGKIIGDPYFDLDVTRLRCFGGSSQHWGGWCRPLDEIDFETWPIKKNDLDNYLSQSCEILEIKDSFYKKKINKNINQINFNISPPVRFNEKYYQKIKKSKKINLILNSPLVRIHGNDKGLVQYIDVANSTRIHKLSVNNLILACGGLENSRILLWNKQISKNNFLKKINPGYYWMDHPHYDVATFVGEKSKVLNLNYAYDKNFFLSCSENFLRKNKLKNLSARFQYQISNEFIDQTIYDLSCSGPKFSRKIMKLFKDNLACVYKVKMSWEQIPNLDSNIILSKKETDNFNIPKINLNWKKKTNDLITPNKFLEEVGNFFINNNLGRIGVYDYVFDKTNFPEEGHEMGGHHHMGGTRMGDGTDKYDVVDKNLRVIDTKNLYVVGSSVFRTGGYANPTLTITQLSLRLGDHLSKIQNFFGVSKKI